MTALLAAATFVLLQLLCQVFATEVSGCGPPIGYVEFPEYNAAYKIHRDWLTWAEAQEQCIAEGGHLAVITSADQIRQIVHADINRPSFLLWIGIHRSSITSPWVRVDNGLSVTSMPWRSPYPNENPNCAVVWPFHGGKFIDFDCHYTAGYICETSLAREGSGREPPSGYVKSPEYNAAYKIHEQDLPWAEAQDRCLAEGAHLAVFTSVQQIRRIVDPAILGSELYLYIGIHRSGPNSSWVRADNGRTVPSIPWEFSTGEECAAVWNYFDGVFVMYNCSDSLRFICGTSLTRGCPTTVGSQGENGEPGERGERGPTGDAGEPGPPARGYSLGESYVQWFRKSSEVFEYLRKSLKVFGSLWGSLKSFGSHLYTRNRNQ